MNASAPNGTDLNKKERKERMTFDRDWQWIEVSTWEEEGHDDFYGNACYGPFHLKLSLSIHAQQTSRDDGTRLSLSRSPR
jgi:hypothetical protein